MVFLIQEGVCVVVQLKTKGSEIPVLLTDFFAAIKKLLSLVWLILTCPKWDNIGAFLTGWGGEASLQ